MSTSKEEFFHGSIDYYDEYVPKGKCVTKSKPYALTYARRKCNGESKGYIYALSLNSEVDLKQENQSGTIDYLLVEKMRFSKRIPVTEQLIEECKLKTAEITNTLTKENSPQLLSDFMRACEKNGIAPTQFVLTVSIAEQIVLLFEKNKFVKKFPCSTSRFGIGQTEGSQRTPLGLHRIAEKIGAGEAAGTVFKSRKVVGHASQPEFADAKITTRILWLEGLEPGLNKGFNGGVNVDSHARYIYIHGTADQNSIGQSASRGCIHLADVDLIPLFNLLPGGTLVWITDQ